MGSTLARLFGRRSAATKAAEALPVEVATAIAGASVLRRGESEDGSPRVLIHAGSGGFVYSRDAARAWLSARWPALSDAQMRRALSMLEGHVKSRIARVQDDGLQRLHANRKRWRSWSRDDWMN
ncbi:hypothetical protein BL248_08375 [Ralstonia solanacearum]|nr:hypothetical protein BL248_08375 [Ralstonia solanacearum]